jgi:glycosyltransferase involved in cell wall biosynthesis
MAAESPRSTIIVPCFNDGATLLATIASALDQERTEIVVVDDGSTDQATLDALTHVSGLGIDVARQENGGPASARMTGLRNTSAPYVFPLDADDVLPAGALATLADVLDANQAVSAVWGDLEMFGDVETVVRTPETIDPWSQTYLNELPGPALFRRDALVEAGGWRLRAGYEDWDLWLSLAERGIQGKRVPIVYYRYRIHGKRGWHRDMSSRHDEIVAEIRRLHPELFAHRRSNWVQSRAPWRLKLGLPLTTFIPLPRRARLAVLHSLSNPKAVVGAAVERRMKSILGRLGTA